MRNTQYYLAPVVMLCACVGAHDQEPSVGSADDAAEPAAHTAATGMEADGGVSNPPPDRTQVDDPMTGGRLPDPPPPIPCTTRDDCDPPEVNCGPVDHDGSAPATATCVRQAACFFGRCVWWNEDWPLPCPAEGCPNQPFTACLENILANCDGCWHDTRCEDKDYCEELSGGPCSAVPSADDGGSQP